MDFRETLLDSKFVNAVEARLEPAQATATPRVSILIPVHDGLSYTRACLESIWANELESIPCEILIVDDQSTDGTVEYLDSLGARVRVVQNDIRKTFAEKMNLAASAAAGEYLCLLNNDTVVTPGWLHELVIVAQDDPTIAIVGNRQLVPATGLIDHAGVVFTRNGSPDHLYRGEDADFWPAQISQEMKVLTAACCLIARERFLELGGFDTTFRNGFEDVDFCLRARQKGYRNYYCADSVIYHHVSSTRGRKDHETANYTYFLNKWAGHLVSDLHEFYFPPPPPDPALSPTLFDHHSIVWSDGWLEAEKDDHSLWRWATGDAVLEIHSTQAGETPVNLRFRTRSLRPTMVEVFLRDRRVAIFPVEPELAEMVEIEFSLRKGLNGLHFRPDIKVEKTPTDTRSLAFMLHAPCLQKSTRVDPRLPSADQFFRWAEGWHDVERSETSLWRWASGAAMLEIHSVHPEDTSVTLAFKTRAFHPMEIEASIRGQRIALFSSGRELGEVTKIEIPVRPGSNILEFRPNAPAGKYPNDDREMSFLLYDPSLQKPE